MARNLTDYQKRYSELPFEETQVQFRKRKVLESIVKYRPRSILEIGCGFDPIFNHYKDYELCTVVEPGNTFVRNARRQAESRANISIVHGTVEKHVELLAFNSYDFILLSSLLHEITDNQGLLKAVSNLCERDTIVHVNVPNARSFHRLLALEMGLIKNLHEPSAIQRSMQQAHTFDVDSLNALVRQSGFDVLEQGTFFMKPFTHAQMAALHSSGFATDLMLDGLYRLSKYFPENGSEIFMNLRRQG